MVGVTTLILFYSSNKAAGEFVPLYPLVIVLRLWLDKGIYIHRHFGSNSLRQSSSSSPRAACQKGDAGVGWRERKQCWSWCALKQ